MSPTFSAFSASIQNTVNTAGSGTLTMQETASGSLVCNSTDGGNVSTNAATCATINKYGGNLNMVPGQAVVTTINIANTGSVPATTFGLAPGACTQANNGSVNGTASDVCSKVNLLIKSGTSTIFTGTAASFFSAGPIDVINKIGGGTTSVAAGASLPFTFTVTVTLDPSATNTYQGLKLAQGMTWTFGA